MFSHRFSLSLSSCLQRNFKKEMLVRIRIKSEDYNPEDAVILERAAKVGIEARRRNLPHLLQTFGYASSMASRFQTFVRLPFNSLLLLDPLNLLADGSNFLIAGAGGEAYPNHTGHIRASNFNKAQDLVSTEHQRARRHHRVFYQVHHDGVG